MALSSSGDLLMLGDSMGVVSIKYAADDATMNPYSLPVEYRDFPSRVPDVHISEEAYYFAAIY
jgi:hypothetical protein